MTKPMWFYPAAALALAAGMMASTAQASPATGPLTVLAKQANLVDKIHYRDDGWNYGRRHYRHGYWHEHYRQQNYGYHHYQYNHYRRHQYRYHQYRRRGW